SGTALAVVGAIGSNSGAWRIWGPVVWKLMRRRGLDPAAYPGHAGARRRHRDQLRQPAILGRVPRLADHEEATKAPHDAAVGLAPLQRYPTTPRSRRGFGSTRPRGWPLPVSTEVVVILRS